MRLPLVGQSYTSRSLAVNAQQTLNLYPEVIDDVGTQRTILDPNQQGKNKAALYGTPGRHLFKAQTYPTRCVWSGGGRLFIVSGRADGGLDLVELASATGAEITQRSLTAAGVDDGLPSFIAANGTQLLIVSNGLAYCDSGAGPVACTFRAYAGVVTTAFIAGVQYVFWVSGDKFLSDLTWVGSTIVINGVNQTVVGASPTTVVIVNNIGTLTNVVYSHAGAAVTAAWGAYLDGYFIVQRPRGGSPDLGRQINLSAILDGTTWSGLDFITKEAWPDYIRTILVDNEQLYIFGDATLEVWQNNPNAGVGGFPLAIVTSATSRYGTASRYAVGSLDGKVFFLGGDDRGQLRLYMMNGGYTPVPVSTHAEESSWNAAQLGGIGAIMYAYLEEGHSFVVVNFGSATWVYDAANGAWHERAKWSGSTFTAYYTHYHTFIPEFTATGFATGGVHITAGQLDGNIHVSSVNIYDDNGSDIAWRRALPYVYASGRRQFFRRLDLMMETGTVASGAAPLITMDYSDDNGGSFVNPRTAAAGVHLATAIRLWWNRNGQSRGRIFRFFGSGQSKVALVDCECEVVEGTS